MTWTEERASRTCDLLYIAVRMVDPEMSEQDVRVAVEKVVSPLWPIGSGPLGKVANFVLRLNSQPVLYPSAEQVEQIIFGVVLRQRQALRSGVVG